FIIIRKKLVNPVILIENIYNINKTDIFLSILNSLKVLVNKNKLRDYKKVKVKYTLIIIIKYIS
ncbi:uncharacterized protein K444DRAFT_508344, partial [Hyaloscypha bicolor E]